MGTPVKDGLPRSTVAAAAPRRGSSAVPAAASSPVLRPGPASRQLRTTSGTQYRGLCSQSAGLPRTAVQPAWHDPARSQSTVRRTETLPSGTVRRPSWRSPESLWLPEPAAAPSTRPAGSVSAGSSPLPATAASPRAILLQVLGLHRQEEGTARRRQLHRDLERTERVPQ